MMGEIFSFSKILALGLLAFLMPGRSRAATATIGLYTTKSPSFEAPNVLSMDSNNAVSLP